MGKYELYASHPFQIKKMLFNDNALIKCHLERISGDIRRQGVKTGKS